MDFSWINVPAAVLRMESANAPQEKYAPISEAIPRIYVPLEQLMRTVIFTPHGNSCCPIFSKSLKFLPAQSPPQSFRFLLNSMIKLGDINLGKV